MAVLYSVRFIRKIVAIEYLWHHVLTCRVENTCLENTIQSVILTVQLIWFARHTFWLVFKDTHCLYSIVFIIGTHIWVWYITHSMTHMKTHKWVCYMDIFRFGTVHILSRLHTNKLQHKLQLTTLVDFNKNMTHLKTHKWVCYIDICTVTIKYQYKS